MKKSGSTESHSASELIDKRIAELGDWRGETLSRMRKLIKEADKDVVEEVKWVKPSNPGGVPTWTHDSSERRSTSTQRSEGFQLLEVVRQRLVHEGDPGVGRTRLRQLGERVDRLVWLRERVEGAPRREHHLEPTW